MKAFGQLNLLALQGSEVMDKTDEEGASVRGVFIPFEPNYISYSKKYNRAMLNMDCRDRQPNPENITHNIKPYIAKKNRKTYWEKYGTAPFIGVLKMTGFTQIIPRKDNISDIFKDD